MERHAGRGPHEPRCLTGAKETIVTEMHHDIGVAFRCPQCGATHTVRLSYAPKTREWRGVADCGWRVRANGAQVHAP
jgi:predicted RNA-binding Zn-ribbon protein involved in translation (DUF1610 family)